MAIERTAEDVERFHSDMRRIAKHYTVQSPHYVTIANAIFLNCKEYCEGRLDQTTWKANQNALWKEAADKAIAADVMRIVCPSLTKVKS